MQFSYINENQRIFNKEDLNKFKEIQVRRMLHTKEKFEETQSVQETSINMTNDYEFNLYSDLSEDINVEKPIRKSPATNTNTNTNIIDKTYEGAEINVNNPPVAPYPFLKK